MNKALIIRTVAIFGFISLCTLFVAAPSGQAQQVDVDISNMYQTMDGTAGNAYGFITNSVTWSPKVLDMILEDLTVTHVRFRSAINKWEPNNDNSDPNAINWSGFKDQNYVTQDFTLIKKLCSAGVEPILGIWEVPDWMVTNPGVTQYRIIPPNMYPEFAELIVTYIIYAKQNYNADINIIGIQNEPNIGVGNYFSPTELAAVTKVVYQYLDKYGLGHVKLHVADVNEPTDCISYSIPTLNDPNLKSRALAISYHTWHYMTPTNLGQVRDFAKSHGLQNWATEVGTSPLNSTTYDWAIGCMKNHHYAMKYANTSLCFQWTLGGAETSIDKYGNPHPIFWALHHYHHNIKPGSIRVDSVGDTGSLFTTSFIDRNLKKLSLVTINSDSYSKNVNYRMTAPQTAYSGPVEVHKTTSSLHYEKMSNLVLKSDNSFDYLVDSRSFHSFSCKYNNLPQASLSMKPNPVNPGRRDYTIVVLDKDGIANDMASAGLVVTWGSSGFCWLKYTTPNPPKCFEASIDSSGTVLTMKLKNVPVNCGLVLIGGGLDIDGGLAYITKQL